MKMNKKQLRRNNFSLLEVIVAITIVAIVATIAVQNLTAKADEANVKTAEIQINSFKSAITTYRLNTGKYPNSLEDLVRNPGVNGWKQELEQIPKDPWGNPYMYNLAPGTFNQYEIISYGADGQAGGTGVGADITLSKSTER